MENHQRVNWVYTGIVKIPYSLIFSFIPDIQPNKYKMKLQYKLFSICILFSSMAYSNISNHSLRGSNQIQPGDSINQGPNNSSAKGVTLPDVSPVDEASIPTPSTRALNTALPVGTTQGEFLVSSTGAASYNIPLVVPPGINGMEPNLAIEYNNQRGMGLLGIGWDLVGISTISRVAEPYFLNQNSKPIDLTNDDLFALDGNYLILDPGSLSNGTEGATYTTYIETFQKITCHSNGTFPTWFEVATNDGETIEYGKTADSRVEWGSTPGMWRINKVTDRFGNSMKYTYYEDNGESFIKTITYTFNDAAGLTTATNTITFNYVRNNISGRYFCLKNEDPFSKNTVLLNGITVSSVEAGTTKVVHSYNFNYTMNAENQVVKLYEIGETGSDNTKYNSTLINWGTMAQRFTQETYSLGELTEFTDLALQNIDYNGDGKDEIMFLNCKLDLDDQYTDWGFFKVPTSGTKVVYDQIIDYAGWSFGGITVCDWDSDGTDEFYYNYLAWDTYYYPNGQPYLTFYSFVDKKWINKYLISESDTGSTISFKDDLAKGTVGYCIPIDMDGNGIKENLYAYEGTDDKIAIFGGTTQVDFSGTYKDIKVIDYNADGKEDLWVTKSNNYPVDNYPIGKVWTIEKSGGSYVKKLIIDYDHFEYNKDNHFFLEYNGDGRIDELVIDKDGANYVLKIAPNGGDGTCPFVTLSTFITLDTSVTKNFFIKDLNNDGLSDIIFTWSFTNPPVICILFNEGNGKFREFYCGISSVPKENDFCFGDFNGDGTNDIAYVTEADKKFHVIYMYKSTHATPNQNLMVSSITNGFNLTTSIGYLPLTDAAVHTKGSTAAFPLNDYAKPLYVVASTSIPQENGTQATINYTYTEARIDRQGRGFLGFSRIVANGNGKIITDAYGLDNTYKYPKLTGKLVQATSGSYLSTYNYIRTNIPSSNGKSYFSYNSSTSCYDYLKQTSTLQEMVYDANGNLTFSSSKPSSTSTPATTNITYTLVKGAYLPKLVTKTQKIGDEPAFTQVTDNRYLAVNGALSTSWIGSAVDSYYLERKYSTDAFGNVTKKTEIASNGGGTREEYYKYDATNRFVSNITYMASQLVYQATFNAFGQPLTETDFNGQTTTYIYDGFGRVTDIDRPQSDDVHVTRAFMSKPTASVNYFVTTTTGGSPETTVFYTSMGNEKKIVTQGFNGLVTVDKTYDSKGKLTSETKPYYASDTKRYINYSYHPTYEYLTQTSDNGIITKQAISKFVTTVTEPNGNVVTKTTDGMGNITNISETNGNTVSYVYHSCGKPKTITSGTNVIQMDYDAAGNQKTLVDPNVGQMDYVYNAFGELESQKDAAGVGKTFDYNNLGQVTFQYTPYGTISYKYYESGAGIGQIKTISGMSNTKSFVYDAYGQLTSVTDNVLNESTVTTTYGYDSYGRPITESHGTGFGIAYEYDTNYGYLKKIKYGATVLWELTSTWANSSVKGFNLGGIASARDYDAYDHLKSIDYNLVKYYTSFDPKTGNLDSCYNSYSGEAKKERFVYDSFDRLTSITGGSAATIEYSTDGNITSKTKAGFYKYKAAQPNAVSSVSTIDEAENDPSLPLDKTSAIITIPTDVSTVQQSMNNTWFNKTASIAEGTNQYNIYYGTDQQRNKMVLKNLSTSAISSIKYYHGNFEKIIYPGGNVTVEYLYVNSPTGLCATIEKTNGTRYIRYAYTNYQGSVTGTRLSTASAITHFSYDVWGRLRDPLTYAYTATSAPVRGYTGHEHLENIKLINMNGRMYDPILGRMLSPDNEVTYPLNAQNYNRYSYCLNNPTKYTDPSGNSVILGISIVALWYGGQVLDNHYNKGMSWKNSFKMSYTPQGGVGYSGGINFQPQVYSTNYRNYSDAVNTARTEARINYEILYSNDWHKSFASNITIVMNRIYESTDATLSRYIVYGLSPSKTISGYILEPGGPSTTTWNQDRRVPAGIYDIVPYSSSKHPNVYGVSNNDVPADRSILIHSGNYHYDTSGCFLPGSSYSKVNGNYAVWNSKTTFNQIHDLIGTNNAYLIIYDNIKYGFFNFGW
jgi:RHS repeat-associated protein